MNREELEKLLSNINDLAETHTYMQIADVLKDISLDDLIILEDMSLITSSALAYVKIQKAVDIIRTKKKPKVIVENNNLIINIINRLDTIPIEQLMQIKNHLENKESLTKNENDFMNLLDKKINERNGKTI